MASCSPTDPDIYLILYGANDAIMSYDSETAIANLEGIINAAKANKTIPVIATLTPMHGEHSIYDGDARDISFGIRQLAAQEGIALVDLESAFGSDESLIGGRMDCIRPPRAISSSRKGFYNVVAP